MTRRVGQPLDAVRLYSDLDLCLVPGEPSHAQCLAGAEAGRVSPEAARLIYRAMLEADELSGSGL
jgi:hypothetical protein